MKKSVAVCMSLFLTLLLLSPASSHAIMLKSTIADPLKPWTITFNQPVNQESVNSSTVYIDNGSGGVHPSTLSVSADLKKITVKPVESYELGTNYRVVVTKGVKSGTQKQLKEPSEMAFTYTGTYITAISAPLNPFVTNVSVKTGQPTVSLTVSVNGGTEQPLLATGTNSYAKGLRGLAAGDRLTVRAFDKSGTLLEEQQYIIRN